MDGEEREGRRPLRGSRSSCSSRSAASAETTLFLCRRACSTHSVLSCTRCSDTQRAHSVSSSQLEAVATSAAIGSRPECGVDFISSPSLSLPPPHRLHCSLLVHNEALTRHAHTRLYRPGMASSSCVTPPPPPRPSPRDSTTADLAPARTAACRLRLPRPLSCTSCPPRASYPQPRLQQPPRSSAATARDSLSTVPSSRSSGPTSTGSASLNSSLAQPAESS